MYSDSVREQVDQIREVFSYLERFHGHLFVIKIDYAIIAHQLLPSLVKDIARLHRAGIRIIIVAGARQWIDTVLALNRISSATVGHTRISSSEAMPYIKMAAFDAATRVMTFFSGNAVSAVVGNWVRAKALGVLSGVDYQFTGVVEKVKTELVERVLGDGFVPIFPCIGWNAAGEPYNISSDELASALGINLKADKVFYVTDSAGVESSGFRVPPAVTMDRSGRIPGLRLDQALELLELNREHAEAPWYGLLDRAYETCRAGVKRVHIVDGRVEGVILKEVFSNLGSGTMIYANEYESIRSMRAEDISDVLRIMEPFIRSGVLVNRDETSLNHSLNEYVVYEVDGVVHGCGGLHPYGSSIGEVVGIAVDEHFAQLGIGFRIVSFLKERAGELGLDRLFLLTTRASDWFQQLGFRAGTLAELPEEKRSAYDTARNSRIMICDVRAESTS